MEAAARPEALDGEASREVVAQRAAVPELEQAEVGLEAAEARREARDRAAAVLALLAAVG